MLKLPTDQRDQLKLVVTLATIALGLYYWQFPYTERVTALDEQRERVERLEVANERAAREIARGSARSLKAQATRARATLEVLRGLVPAEHEVPALLEEVSTAARRAGLELGGVQPEPVIPGDQFDTHRYRMTVVGHYHALTSFLANVGSLPRIVAPVTFALVPAKERGGRPAAPGAKESAMPMLQATVTVQTYVAHAAPLGPRDPAAAPARAGEVLP